jgi:sugar phosphate isomerase/epimerase
VGPDWNDAAGILREAVDERIQVGEGALPLAAVLRELPTDLPLSLELRSKYLRDAYPDPAERASAVARVTRNFLRHCEKLQ